MAKLGARNGDGNIVRRHSGVPDNFKPFTDRSVPTLVVPCPQCGAKPGDKCVSTITGEQQKNCHRVRRRMAVRLQNETRNEVDLP